MKLTKKGQIGLYSDSKVYSETFLSKITYLKLKYIRKIKNCTKSPNNEQLVKWELKEELSSFIISNSYRFSEPNRSQ